MTMERPGRLVRNWAAVNGVIVPGSATIATSCDCRRYVVAQLMWIDIYLKHCNGLSRYWNRAFQGNERIDFRTEIEETICLGKELIGVGTAPIATDHANAPCMHLIDAAFPVDGRCDGNSQGL